MAAAGGPWGRRGVRRGRGGRPMAQRRRVVVDAIRYLVRYGVEWRALPVDFPPWQGVYAFFERWGAPGLPPRAGGPLRGRLAGGAGAAAGGGAGGRGARQTADRCGDRLSVGQGRRHGGGRDQRIRRREEDQGPRAARGGGEGRGACG